MDNIQEPYGFIYITTNLINGKRYIGQKSFDKKDSHKGYLGSGSALKKAIKKYKRENFSRTIISFAYSLDELNQQEYELVKFFDASNNRDYYNLMEGGKSHKMSEEARKHQSEGHLKTAKRGKNSPMYGKHLSEETKRKIQDTRKRLGLSGGYTYTMSEKGKQGIKEGWTKTKKRVRQYKPVKCIETGEVYQSVSDAERKIGCCCGSVGKICRKEAKYKTLYGKHYEFISKEEYFSRLDNKEE